MRIPLASCISNVRPQVEIKLRTLPTLPNPLVSRMSTWKEGLVRMGTAGTKSVLGLPPRHGHTHAKLTVVVREDQTTSAWKLVRCQEHFENFLVI